jgi:hypothetical protein
MSHNYAQAQRCYVPCRIPQLPPPTLIEAAKRAVRLNPANAVARGPARAQMPELPIGHLAALTGKVWPAGGVHLRVQFLDNPDKATRDKILQHANAWSRTANVLFTEVASGGQVRITRTRGQGYWSYLGTDILSIPANQPTMNLEGFDARTTPDSEFYRVVRHEFGHTLSWPHEHTRKEIVGRIDPQAADAYFLKYDGWDAETVRQQVLTITPDEEITALPADVKSIMAYGLPAEIMKDRVAVPGGNDIDDEDYALAAKVYPKGDTGGGGGPLPGKLFTLTFRQSVRAGGIVNFRTKVGIPAGVYDVVPEGVAGHADVEAEVS